MKFVSKLEVLVAFLVVGVYYLIVSGQASGISLNPQKKYAAELAQTTPECDPRINYTSVAQQL